MMTWEKEIVQENDIFSVIKYKNNVIPSYLQEIKISKIKGILYQEVKITAPLIKKFQDGFDSLEMNSKVKKFIRNCCHEDSGKYYLFFEAQHYLEEQCEPVFEFLRSVGKIPSDLIEDIKSKVVFRKKTQKEHDFDTMVIEDITIFNFPKLLQIAKEIHEEEIANSHMIASLISVII
ncbi:MAG: hypothetical protein JWM09_1201 [Francisellaceae bacterium]|nr:hypothetical protein [Francisellaceae bacterium]